MNRITRLRVSLLFSLGLVPLACSGDDDAGAGGAGAANQGGSGHFTCTSPRVDAKTGLVNCAEGYAHRPQAVACTRMTGEAGSGGGQTDVAQSPRAHGEVACGDQAPSGGAGGASDCNAFYLGYCDISPMGFGNCESGCVTDQDCGKGYVCVCGDDRSPSGGTCHPSSCKADADCGSSFLCASWTGACGDVWFSCQTADDECAGDADCQDGICEPDGEISRACVSGDQCGRPFLVEGAARVAPVVASNDWNEMSPRKPQIVHLGAAERTALAEHWTRLGQMEHASIAAFARFSLQLLSLGAPPHLVEGCTAALADETAHTKLCFELASAYAGRAIGPGPLDIERSLHQTSLLEIVDLVIAEGCFGETLAALTALEAADTAADPVIRAAYARIAHDEQNHAALAFRFVRWALEQNPTGVQTRISAALRRLPPDFKARVVVEPCLLALLSEHASAPPKSDYGSFFGSGMLPPPRM